MSTFGGDGDIERLKDELRRCTEARDKLIQSTSQMREMVTELEQHLNKDTSSNSSLREEYEKQVEKNSALEKEVEKLQQELSKMQGQRVSGAAKGLQAYDGMTQFALKKLLRTLEKEKVEIEWELKEIEWRLDQEASAVSKAKEEREAIQDQLAQLKSQIGSHQ